MRARSTIWPPGPVHLGFGGAPIGNLFDAVDEEHAVGAIESAWDVGIRYFDTAPHYGLGLSERRLGEVLRTRPRDDFVVSTKVGRRLAPADGSGPDPEGFVVPAALQRVRDYSADGVRRCLEASLDRLALDRVDLVLIHDPHEHVEQALEEAAPALSRMRAQGVIRGYGVGMNDPAVLTRFVRETDVDVVMLAGRYTLLDQSAAHDLLPAALENEVGVINAGVYNSGLLARPWPVDSDPYDYGAAAADVLERARTLACICRRYGTDLPTAAVAFASRHPAVVAVVVGLRDAAQARELGARWRAPVPDDLWPALLADGLIDPCALA